MLDFIGTVAITAIMVVAINAVISTLEVSRARRIAAAIAVGLWIGFAAASASIGLFAVSDPFPLIGLYLLAPLLAVAAVASLSPAWRSALLALPAPLLIGLNVSRLLGVFFLLLAAESRLSGPFPLAAGLGDIVVGALALPAAFLALRPAPSGRSLLLTWNALGALDLVVAVGLGIASAQGSPLQLFEVTAGSTAMQHLPWAFVPTVLVPFYLIVHAILFAKLRLGAPAARSRDLITRAA